MDNHFSIKIFSSLNPDIKQSAWKLKDDCFGWQKTYTPEKKIEHEDKFCSKKDLFKYILAIENNKIIGLTMLYKRKIKYQSKNLILGGFGEVCTKKEKRRQGVATAMLKKGIEELKKAKCDIAYLCTNIHDSSMINLYQKIDFVILGKPHSFFEKSGKKYIERDGMIAPVNSEKIFQEILKSNEMLSIGKGNW